MAKNKLKYRCFIEIGDSEPVLMDSLSPEERKKALETMSERLSVNMSAWYSQHPELIGELR